MTRSAFVAVSALLALLSPAAATPVFFSDLASFQANAPALDYESFEGSSHPNTTSVAIPGGTYDCTDGVNFSCALYFGSVDLTAEGINLNDPSLAAHHGDVALGFTTDQTATFNFTAPVTAFGIFIGGGGNVLAGPTLQTSPLTLTATVGSAFEMIYAGHTNLGTTFPGNTAFFGVVDPNGISSIAFEGFSAGADLIFLDSMYTASEAAPVPLPAGLPLLAGALALAGLATNRRKA